MIIPANLNKNTPIDIVTIKKPTPKYDVETKVNLDILDSNYIKNKVNISNLDIVQYK